MKELKEVFRKVIMENYANFNGRAGRKEFWLYFFMQYLYMMIAVFIMYFFMIIFMIAGIVNSTHSGSSPFFPLMVILGLYGGMFLFFLPILLPTLAVTARRLHDTNRSGWWMLLGFVPLGGFVVWFFLIAAGDKGANQYGEDPLLDEYKEYFEKIYPHLAQNPQAES